MCAMTVIDGFGAFFLRAALCVVYRSKSVLTDATLGLTRAAQCQDKYA